MALSFLDGNRIVTLINRFCIGFVTEEPQVRNYDQMGGDGDHLLNSFTNLLNNLRAAGVALSFFLMFSQQDNG